MKDSDSIIDVSDLFVEFQMKHSTVYPVNGVSYHVKRGEIVGFVGESGSGKSVTQLSTMHLLPQPQGKIVHGSVVLDGRDITELKNSSSEMRRIRGAKIAMIFQEPMSSLNPVMPIGKQITEAIMLHQKISSEEAEKKAVELLELVRIPDAGKRLSSYPHQFSGGMCQRIMIAIAMASNPDLLIADEATTALDVTIQAQILELLRDIVHRTNTSLIIITHNLGIVARYADRIYVMYGGTVVESGSIFDIFRNPSHPYTIGLLHSIPSLTDDKDRKLVPIDGSARTITEPLRGCAFYARCTQKCESCSSLAAVPALREIEDGHYVSCIRTDVDRSVPEGEPKSRNANKDDSAIIEIRDLKMFFPVYSGGVFKRRIGENKALNGITLSIRKGSSIGLVGESGCGKTTLAKCIMRLYKPTSGQIIFDGRDIAGLPEKELKDLRQKIQFVFQDPYGSLNPRKKIGYIVGQPLLNNGSVHSRQEYEKEVDRLFSLVGLDPSMKDRFPHELSGGQRQRIGIARALASRPEIIVCDEPVSALDVSIQAQVLNLLEKLQSELGLTIIFIAHDLSVVRHVCDNIAVMYLGRILEYGDWEKIYSNARHPYTQMLFSAIPIPDPEKDRKRDFKLLNGEIPSVLNVPEGCNFHTRCPYSTAGCSQSVPSLDRVEDNHFCACLRSGMN